MDLIFRCGGKKSIDLMESMILLILIMFYTKWIKEKKLKCNLAYEVFWLFHSFVEGCALSIGY